MELEIKNLLKAQGFSATKSRMSVLGALLRLQPATMRQLVVSLPDVDRATIYRTVDLFVDLGIAKKIYTGFKYRVELGDDFQEHHHHLTCLRCGIVVDFQTPEIERDIKQITTGHGFRPIRHDLEIIGYCASCS